MQAHTRIAALKAAAIVTVLFGAATWLAVVWSTARAFLTGLVDVAIWPILDGAQRLEGAETNMLLAIVAGFSFAIAAVTWLIADRVMPHDEALGRLMVGLPMGIWFVTDSLASIAGGAGGNALLNVGFALVFLVPAAWPGARESAAASRG